MPVITVCQNGISMGFPPGKNDHVRAKRGVAQGWTKTATRSNRRFLWCVNCPDLGQNGYSFTLTLAECPPSPEAWTRLRGAFQKRIEREGGIRVHWLTEWQRRGVPHLHGCVWFPVGENSRDGATIVHHWLQVAKRYGAERQGQDTKPITGALGWLKYLAKHADRGVFNYQRSSDSAPEGWRGSKGRMWGHTGEWPLTDPLKLSIDHPGSYALRRIAQRWRLANARTDPDANKRPGRIRSARRLLQHQKRNTSSVRGVAEWLPAAASHQALIYLAAAGHVILWVPDVEESDTQTLPGFE